MFKSTLDLVFMEASNMNPVQLGSSLILVNIVCNTGYLRADERADDKSCDWWEKG